MQESKYDQGYHPILAAGLAHRGLTQEEIAAKLEIKWSTFQRWLKEHWQFAKAIREGESFVVAQVENALVRSAVGYEVVEEHTSTNLLTGEVKTAVATKTILPNVKAQIFFLKNKAPEYWSDRASSEDSKSDAPIRWEETRQEVKPEHLEDICSPQRAAETVKKWQN